LRACAHRRAQPEAAARSASSSGAETWPSAARPAPR
jgi:hypothetical protein